MYIKALNFKKLYLKNLYGKVLKILPISLLALSVFTSSSQADDKQKNSFSGSSVSSSTNSHAYSNTHNSKHNYETRIFSLQHRNAESLLSVVGPLLNNLGSITADRNKLIVHSSPQKITEIEQLLKSLDTPLAQLLITVRQGGNLDSRSGGVGLGGNITHTQHGTDAAGNVVIRRTVTKNSRNQSHQVRVLESHRAYIHTGTSQPLLHYKEGQLGKHKYQSTHTEYRDVVKGFYVTPQLHGERVSLTVHAQHDEIKNNTTQLQRLNTTVSGRLGEWIALGGTTRQDNSRTAGLNTSGGSTNKVNKVYSMQKQNSQTVYLKVERVN